MASLVLAAMLHGNMNDRPLFDALWMAGLFISTVAVLPQLWLITRTGGCIEALTSHYIAAMAASRAMSGNFNHTGWAILAAHLLQMLLLGDFGYYYVKAVLLSGLNCRIQTLEDCNV